MANWLLEKLKKLFETNITISDSFNFTLNITNNSNKKGLKFESKNPFVQDKNIIHINIDQLNAAQLKILKEISITNIKNGNYLLEIESSDLLQRLYKYNKNKDGYSQYLEFFKDIIPKDDYKALELAYFLRVESDKKRNISEYKKEIRQQYGKRGGHIANLCTAGYFEQFLQPVYNY